MLRGLLGIALLSFLLFGFPAAGSAQEASPGETPPKAPDATNLPSVPYHDVLKEFMATAPHGSIRDVQTGQEDGNLVVSVTTSGELAHQEFILENPPRLVVDFINTRNYVPLRNLAINQAQVKRLRVRQFQSSEPMIARLVFDLAEGHGAHYITSGEGSLRISFEPGAGSEKEANPLKGENGQEETLAEPTQPAAVAEDDQTHITPVISDLAISEIPQSALLAEKIEEPIATNPKPTPKTDVEPSPPTPKPSTPAPTMTISPLADSKYGGHPLTLDLVDISLVDFFRLMSEEGGLNIVMDPEIQGALSMKVVNLPWDQVFDAALNNNGLDKQIEGNLVRIASKKTLQEEARQRENLKKAELLAADLKTEIKRLNYAKAEAFLEPIKNQLTVRGIVVLDERTNSLVITDIPESVDKVVNLVESLDTPQPQVEIEARIVSATRDFARDIGVQFGFVQGNLERVSVGGPNTFGTIGGTRPAATPTTTFSAGRTDRGRGAAESKSSESAGVSPSNTDTKAGNFNVNLPAIKAFGGLGISVGNIFDTFLLDAAITAGESKGLAKLISQPKVTAQNNAPAQITQGLRFPVQIIANNTVTVQFQNAALTLTVTPQITYDNNIVLDLKVENNTPDFSRQVNGIPSIRTSESETRVLVTDGGTTVIGGILIDNETNQEERIPGLASLPILGHIFKRTVTERSTQEVLFFITPRIVR
jgi:type IV pilus assembly protein PilQ